MVIPKSSPSIGQYKQSNPTISLYRHNQLKPQIIQLNHLTSSNRLALESTSSSVTMINPSEDLLLSYGAGPSTPSPPPHHPSARTVQHPPPPPSPPTGNGINLTLPPSASVSTVNLPSALVPLNKRITKRRADKFETGPTRETGDDALLSCLVCGKNFISFGRLKSHEKTHSKSRPFKCIDCGKTFTVRYSLICHIRVHTRERPYGCSFCGSRFSQASSLKTHQIYKHTREFPYLCKYCGRGFISPGQKHEHIQRTHHKTSFSSNASTSSSSSSSNSPSSVHLDCQLSRLKSCRPLSEPSTLTQRPNGPKMATTSVQTDIRLPPDLIY